MEILLLKHIEKRIVLPMYFKNEDEARNWPADILCPEKWIIIYWGERKECGHRYELMYSKFDEQGKLYSKYIFCFSKKEAVLLARKMKEANSNYTINIKRLY